jgi:hypothetical protein
MFVTNTSAAEVKLKTLGYSRLSIRTVTGLFFSIILLKK